MAFRLDFTRRLVDEGPTHLDGYILLGQTEDDLPTLYIGQGDGVRNRIEAHFGNKEFWDWGVAFVSHSASGGLNRAHITWLEIRFD